MAVFADPGLELFGIGDRLREARVRRGLELADVERATCIRAANLRAIEEERFDDLAADVYTAGFVRAYADFLGLDGDGLAQYFRETRLHEPPELVHEWIEEPSAHPRRRLAALALCLLLAGGAVAAFTWFPFQIVPTALWLLLESGRADRILRETE
jgi:cytoskeletal protein RodZ